MKTTVAGLLAAGLLSLGASAALADGMPTAAMVDDPVAYSDNDWSGFFISGSIGYGWGSSDTGFVFDDGTPESFKFTADPEGFIGAVGLGYDWTFGRGLVFGVFGDYTIGDLDDKTNDPVANEVTYDNIWAVGGRAGYVIHKDMLLYGTLGYTHADFEYQDNFKDDLNGYFVGAGLERKLHSGWSLKAEYRYSDFDDSEHTDISAGGGCAPTCRADFDVDHEIHSVRVGVAYKFGARREEAVPLK